MNEAAHTDGPTLSVRLELNLERRPITGHLRTDDGEDEHFEGWLGFAEALARVHQHQEKLH